MLKSTRASGFERRHDLNATPSGRRSQFCDIPRLAGGTVSNPLGSEKDDFDVHFGKNVRCPIACEHASDHKSELRCRDGDKSDLPCQAIVCTQSAAYRVGALTRLISYCL